MNVSKYLKFRGVRAKPTVAFSPGANQMAEKLKKIFAKENGLSEEENFILNQAYLICLFRRSNGWRRNKLYKYISEREEKRENFDFIGLNNFILAQDTMGNLPTLVKRIKQKRRKRAKK